MRAKVKMPTYCIDAALIGVGIAMSWEKGHRYTALPSDAGVAMPHACNAPAAKYECEFLYKGQVRRYALNKMNQKGKTSRFLSASAPTRKSAAPI
jgi:hypothetical protein